jgi:hypothetical protein
MANEEYYHEDEDEDDGPSLKYYKSNKVLGRLFRSINEIAFLKELESSMSPDPEAPNVLLALWKYVEYETALLVWDHKLDEAREIKEL